MFIILDSSSFFFLLLFQNKNWLLLFITVSKNLFGAFTAVSTTRLVCSTGVSLVQVLM